MKENRWFRKRLIRAGYLVLKQRSYIVKLHRCKQIFIKINSLISNVFVKIMKNANSQHCYENVLRLRLKSACDIIT